MNWELKYCAKESKIACNHIGQSSNAVRVTIRKGFSSAEINGYKEKSEILNNNWIHIKNTGMSDSESSNWLCCWIDQPTRWIENRIQSNRALDEQNSTD